MPGHSSNHTNQQFNIHLIRDEADDINDDNFIENDHYRLQIDDTEFYENSGSQANLIASDNDTTPPNHNQNFVHYRDNTDSITVESTLTLDDIDNLGIDNITVVESSNEENGPIDDNEVYKGASNKTKLLVDLESRSNLNKNFQNSDANTRQDVNVSTGENYSNKKPVKYNNLFDDRMHPGLIPASSNVYEEMCVGNDSKNIPMTHTLLENEHVPASNVPSNAYAEIRDIEI